MGKVNHSAWVRRTVTSGLTIEFIGCPPNRHVHCPLLSLEKDQLLRREILHLLQIRVIEPVLLDQQGMGFYSVLFLVPKTSGG